MKDKFLNIALICVSLGFIILLIVARCSSEDKMRTYRSYVDVSYQIEGDTTALNTSLTEDITFRNNGKAFPVYFVSNRMPDDTIDTCALVIYGKLYGNGDREYITHNVVVRVPGKKINITNITTDCKELKTN